MFNPSSSITFRPNIFTTATTSSSSTSASSTTQVPNSASSSISNGTSNSVFSDITDSTTMSTNSNHQQQQQHIPPQQTTFGNFSSINSPSSNESPDLQSHHHQQQHLHSSQPLVTGTGASSNPPSNPRISSKFTHHDIQILRQLLLAGEKHKWKQITKEINNSSHHSEHVAAAMNSHRISGISGGTSIPAKNVSPTFVVKQANQLLGFPADFGILQSSMPYVVHGWDAIEQIDYQFQNDST
ncbi:predicted protein [Candida tropicalis MYA-3404]|uniref:Uncharacterized protein n=1 Tax=Candida tropicalis (strain ATCC MYA-3404 / T1) TaxID=294747 RepID=C5MDS5_CANTT|nr:predicted protein [Candida tropicalis MYA-3404]EER32156.1 predicted protein [Candida tropicalis MYA-3404]KAG4405755.1 hypothetical protein JTP64_004626 [Candida tropicalis]